MKEYYCLSLNNYYSFTTHWVCPHKISAIPGVIITEITDLYDIEDKMMDLDNVIVPLEDKYEVIGKFPIFGQILEDGKMHDVITGKEIAYATNPKEACGLSYNAKYKADTAMVEELLSLLNDDGKFYYKFVLDSIKADSRMAFFGKQPEVEYYGGFLNNVSLIPEYAIIKKINGIYIDDITKEEIIPINHYETLVSGLSVNAEYMTHIPKEYADKYKLFLLDNGIENYISRVKEAKINSIRKYNKFVLTNKNEIKRKVK